MSSPADAAFADLDFLVLFPLARVRSLGERLEAHLAAAFPALAFRVGADFAGMAGKRGYCILPVRTSRPDPASPHAILIGPPPLPALVRLVTRAVADFAAGRAGRLN